MSDVQAQGVIFEESPGNYVRFDLFSSIGRMFAYSATIESGSETAIGTVDAAVAGLSPVWLRVTRSGDNWTAAWSADGVAFTDYATFTHAMTVRSVGTHAGNFGAGAAPAHTSLVDYFFNTAYPIP